jgi:YbbR domain-containing protein
LLKYRYHILIASFILSAILWLSLNLNQIYEIEKSVPIRININKPYAVSGNIPMNLDVKFRGIGWNLIRLFTSLNLEFNYDITARKKDQFIILTKEYLDNNLGLTQNLNITSVYPETLFVKIDNYEEKYVRLLPKVYINCREGYQVVSKPFLEPDSIKVGGSMELLRGINHLYTKEQVFDNINSSIVKNISISDSLSNIMWLSQNEVKLGVNIELTAEKEFQNIEIKVPGVPDDKEVLLIPQTISVQLKGGVNQLAAVDNSKIIAKIEYSSILADTTGSLIPKFELPEGCVVISVKPETIQYVIKKKS